MRIAIMGNSGSGKSTLAAQLSNHGAVHVLDLDIIAWEPDRVPTRRPIEAVRLDLDQFSDSHQDWIIEGCYADIIELALSRGPELIFLNPGIEVCIRNCRNRPWEPHKYASKEAQDKNLEFLLNWVRAYDHRDDDCSLRRHRQVFDSYSGLKQENRDDELIAG